MKRIAMAMVCVWGWGAVAIAQDTGVPPAPDANAAVAAPTGIADRMQKRMKSSPDAFVADAAALILGYGTEAGIDAAGIDLAIAVDQAAARARELGRLMQADLDGDGAADAGEIAVLVRAASAKSRGRITLMFQATDTDTDGRVTMPEMMVQAATAAQSAVSPGKMAAMRGLLTLDQNGDGLLTLPEVQAAVARAAQAT